METTEALLEKLWESTRLQRISWTRSMETKFHMTGSDYDPYIIVNDYKDAYETKYENIFIQIEKETLNYKLWVNDVLITKKSSLRNSYLRKIWRYIQVLHSAVITKTKEYNKKELDIQIQKLITEL